MSDTEERVVERVEAATSPAESSGGGIGLTSRTTDTTTSPRRDSHSSDESDEGDKKEKRNKKKESEKVLTERKKKFTAQREEKKKLKEEARKEDRDEESNESDEDIEEEESNFFTSDDLYTRELTWGETFKSGAGKTLMAAGTIGGAVITGYNANSYLNPIAPENAHASTAMLEENPFANTTSSIGSSSTDLSSSSPADLQTAQAVATGLGLGLSAASLAYGAKLVADTERAKHTPPPPRPHHTHTTWVGAMGRSLSWFGAGIAFMGAGTQLELAYRSSQNGEDALAVSETFSATALTTLGVGFFALGRYLERKAAVSESVERQYTNTLNNSAAIND